MYYKTSREEKRRLHFSLLPKFTRRQYNDLSKPMWKRLKDVSGNRLAYRELMLHTRGREMDINCIRSVGAAKRLLITGQGLDVAGVDLVTNTKP